MSNLLKRFAAGLIDYIVFLAMCGAYIYFVGERNPDGTYTVTGIRHILLLGAAWIIYFPVMETSLGYTLAKGLFDLKVVNAKNKIPDFSEALKRHLLDIPDAFLMLTFGFITVRRTGDERRLGDRWAGTRVVEEK